MKVLFICLIALFMSHEQCNRHWLKKKKKIENTNNLDGTCKPNRPLVCVRQKLFLAAFFTIRLIFPTIYGFYYTFWYYSWVSLYYFSQFLPLFIVLLVKSFQFQQNKQIPNKLLVIFFFFFWCRNNLVQSFILSIKKLSIYL